MKPCCFFWWLKCSSYFDRIRILTQNRGTNENWMEFHPFVYYIIQWEWGLRLPAIAHFNAKPILLANGVCSGRIHASICLNGISIRHLTFEGKKMIFVFVWFSTTTTHTTTTTTDTKKVFNFQPEFAFLFRREIVTGHEHFQIFAFVRLSVSVNYQINPRFSQDIPQDW